MGFFSVLDWPTVTEVENNLTSLGNYCLSFTGENAERLHGSIARLFNRMDYSNALSAWVRAVEVVVELAS